MGPEGLTRLEEENAQLLAWQEAPNSPADLAKIPSLRVAGKRSLFRGPWGCERVFWSVVWSQGGRCWG